jgi:hypothetical protein
MALGNLVGDLYSKEGQDRLKNRGLSQDNYASGGSQQASAPGGSSSGKSGNVAGNTGISGDSASNSAPVAPSQSTPSTNPNLASNSNQNQGQNQPQNTNPASNFSASNSSPNPQEVNTFQSSVQNPGNSLGGGQLGQQTSGQLGSKNANLPNSPNFSIQGGGQASPSSSSSQIYSEQATHEFAFNQAKNSGNQSLQTQGSAQPSNVINPDPQAEENQNWGNKDFFVKEKDEPNSTTAGSENVNFGPTPSPGGPAATGSGGKSLDGLLGGGGSQQPPNSGAKTTSDGQDKGGAFDQEAKKKIFVIAGVSVAAILLLVLSVWAIFKYRSGVFNEENVQISLTGPGEVESASQVTYDIEIANANKLNLNQVEVKLEYPEDVNVADESYIQQLGFKNSKITIGAIKEQQKKNFQVSLTPYGPRDRQIFLKATLNYQPSGLSSVFEKRAQKTITIKSSSLNLSLLPTKEVSSGNLVSLEAIVKNESNSKFEDLELRLNYPQGFSFQEAIPNSYKENRYWQIKQLAPGEQKKITITGYLEGEMDTLKRFSGEIGQTRDTDSFRLLSSSEGVSRIVSSQLQISQKTNQEAIYPGDMIGYNIEFKNTSPEILRDLILKQYIKGELIDLERLESRGGYYDSEGGFILWKAADVPDLKLLQPGETGSVSFNMKTKDFVEIKNSDDQNFSIISWSEIESLDVNSPIFENKRVRSSEKEVKFNSKLIFNTEGLYEGGEFSNSGPAPLRVGEETTLEIRFEMLNTINELEDVVVEAKLPTGIKWKDEISPGRLDVDFNQRTNEMKWKVGRVKPGAGFYHARERMYFQVGVVPSVNQLNENVTLVKDIRVYGKDTYTGNEVEYHFSSINSGEIEELGRDGVLPAREPESEPEATPDDGSGGGS